MIVTTCGAAGVLGALGGGAGFLGDGAGVCAFATVQTDRATTNNAIRIIVLKTI
jgi:hypothetical protein